MTGPRVPKTAFLDTGALVRLYAFWEFCKELALNPNSIGDWRDLRDAMRTSSGQLAAQYEEEDFVDVRLGSTLFKRMKAARETCAFFSCRAAYAELHRLILVDVALEELAAQRIPRTMRNKRPLLVYQSALDQSAFKKVNEDLEVFFDDMRHEQSIDIKLLEENNGQGILPDINKILDVAMVLWSHIIIETLDAYMYSAAIICQADYFLTADGALRDMTAKLADQTGEYAAVAERLHAELGLESGVRLPRGSRLRQALN